jgi:thioredoxin reductase (NADPH)
MPVRELLIVGAGPSGLSAAIAAKQHGIDYQVIEQGTLVNAIYNFPPQMVFFTTPELLEIGGLPFVSPYEKPTRAEALRYYRKLVDAFHLQIAFEEKVVSVAEERDQEPDGPLFAVETQAAHALRRARLGRYVVLAIGYYDHPNLMGVPGEDLPHVHHYYGDPHPYYRRRVVIVGGGNSAAESALDLFRAGAHVTLIHRWAELKSTIKYWVKPDIENRIKEGSIAARFNTHLSEIRQGSVIVTAGGAGKAGRAGGDEELPADAVFLLTGYHPDYELLSGAGVTLDGRGVPAYSPDTFETNVPGLFVAGGVIAGKDTAPIFIENGRFHGERIVETIARRIQSLTG